MSAGVVVFPFAVIFAVSSVQMAHRKWFAATGALAWASGLHRSNRWIAGTAAAGVFMLAATGLYLWLANRGERKIGTLLALPAGSLALALIVSMRAC